MIRPYKLTDKENLLEVFKLNTPKYFDPLEIDDFEIYLEKHGDTYFVLEVDQRIIGGLVTILSRTINLEA